MNFKIIRAAACAALALAMAGARTAAADDAPFHKPAVACDPDNAGLTLPSGFCALVVADGVTRARHLVITSNGNIYVAQNPARDGSDPGALLALRDTNGDGRADERQVVYNVGGNGLAYRFDHLFFGTNDSVLRWSLPPWDFVPASPPQVVVSGMPDTGDHVSKTVVVTPDAKLFVNIGSASNTCQVQNRVPWSPGVNPCPELVERAGVWRFSAGTTGQLPVDGERYAAGVRNAVALALSPYDGGLYAVQNGRDQLHESFPKLFTPEQDATLPSEEFLRLTLGRDYGWPYCYHDPVADKMMPAPEYRNNGPRNRCDNVEEPDFAFPAHWAPLSMLFYTGAQFPDYYRSGVFVAFHGSRFDPLNQPAGPGYNVVFLPMAQGHPAKDYDVFADGFIGVPPTTLPDDALHRPVGLAEGPDGSLYISDDKGGRIYRILYNGSDATGVVN